MKRTRGTLRPSKILIIGEAPGEQEERLGTLFVGASGRELDSMLADAGISRAACALTNVFDVRPPNNSLLHWSVPKNEVSVTPGRPFAYISPDTGRYIDGPYVHEALERLRDEIRQVSPNIIVALGNTAMAAVTGVSGIGKIRGTLHLATLVGGYQLTPDGLINERQHKVLATYHPAAVLRQYEHRPTVVLDLRKALMESAFPDLRLRRRALYLEPTVEDLFAWRERLLAATLLAVDCETKAGQITCVGFSPSAEEAYVIPFWDRRNPGGHYWPDAASERIAWEVCKQVLESRIPKLLQNGLYDTQYFLRYKWFMRRFEHDTMIKHHSLYPGLPKGLDFLGSIYANERAWKKFRPRGGEEKREA